MRREEDDAVRDGEVVRVPLYLMDAVQRSIALTAGNPIHDGMGNAAGFKPGYCFNSDAVQAARRQIAYDDYKRELANAWRGPARERDEAVSQTADTRDAAYAAYQAYDDWLRNAWRGPR